MAGAAFVAAETVEGLEKHKASRLQGSWLMRGTVCAVAFFAFLRIGANGQTAALLAAQLRD